MKRSKLLSDQSEVDEPAVNLTALIDIVFVILIMFIVIAPFLELDRVELASAPANNLIHDSLPAQQASPIAIHVQRDNTIWLNQRHLSVSQLTAELLELKKMHPNAQPQLFHDKSAHFGTYQLVKNSVEAAGFTHMDIILKPD